MEEVIEEKVKKTVSIKIILFSVTLLILCALNIAGINLYFKTEINWFTFLLYSFTMSLPISVLCFYIIRANQKKSRWDMATKTDYKNQNYKLLEVRIGAFFLGLFFYVLFLLFTPLVVNYYFTDKQNMEFETTEFTYNLEQENKSYGTSYERSYHTKIQFKHNEVMMKIETTQPVKSRLVYTIQKGALGFNVLKEVRFNNLFY